MLKVRTWLSVLIVVLLLVSFAATNAQDSASIQLMGWSSSPAENAALEAMVAAFEADNPNINVEVNLVPEYDTTLQAAFASGNPPHVFYVDSSRLPDFVDAGVIAPGGDLIEDQAGFYPALLDVFTIDGTLYCPPKDFSTMALQYNSDLFDAAGLDYPTNDWTWDDLIAASEALTSGDVVGLVVPPELPRWLPFLYQAGGAIFNEDGELVFDSEESLTALELYLGMVEDGIAAPPSRLDSGWGGEAFGKARAAMAMEGNWVIQFMIDNYPDVNWGVVELPAGPAGEATMAFTVCYGVASNNNNPEASWELVNFLTGETGAMMVAEAGFGVMPARTSAAETWLQTRGVEFEAFVNGADHAYRWQLPVGFGAFTEEFNSALQDAMSGSLFADEVLEDTVSVAQEILGE